MKNITKYLWYTFLAIIVLIGIYSFYLQTTEGHYLTGTSKYVPWGIYIAAFAFFVGASAGATLIGFFIYAFKMDGYKPLAIRAILVGIVSLSAAIFLVMADVGQPLRMFKIPWILSNSSSMFFISSLSYYLFMIVLLAELYFGIKELRGKANKKEKMILKWLAILAVPYALLIVHMVTGFIFGVIKSREYWNTSLLPLHFIVAALASGMAIMILVSIFSEKIRRTKPVLDTKTFNHTGLMLMVFVLITLLFDLSDAVVLQYSDKPEGMEAWRILTSEHAGLFIINVSFLIIAFLVLIFRKGRRKTGLGVASILTLVAIAAYRYNLVIVPQKVPLLPGINDIEYLPTVVEISVIAGIIALVILVYSLATKILPMVSNGAVSKSTETIDEPITGSHVPEDVVSLDTSNN